MFCFFFKFSMSWNSLWRRESECEPLKRTGILVQNSLFLSLDWVVWSLRLVLIGWTDCWNCDWFAAMNIMERRLNFLAPRPWSNFVCGCYIRNQFIRNFWKHQMCLELVYLCLLLLVDAWLRLRLGLAGRSHQGLHQLRLTYEADQ